MADSREVLVHDIVLLAQQRMSVRAIARALHVGRNRVRAILVAHAVARDGASPPSALPPPPVKGKDPVRGFFGGTDQPAPQAAGTPTRATLLLCVILQADEDERPATAVDAYLAGRWADARA